MAIGFVVLGGVCLLAGAGTLATTSSPATVHRIGLAAPMRTVAQVIGTLVAMFGVAMIFLGSINL